MRRIFSNTLIVMVATLASRALGLLREVVIAARFGTGEDYSAYVAAFKIPDMLFLVLSGGALGSALIPVFAGMLGQGEKDKAWRLANAVVNDAFIALLVSGIFAFVFAPYLVSWVVAPNFSPAQQELTTSLTRLLLLQPIMLGMGAIASSVLNGMERFLVPALAPLFYNLSIILGALFLSQSMGVYGLVAGVIGGAVFYLVIQIPAMFRAGFRFKAGLDWQAEGVRRVLGSLGPRLIGQAALQINFIVITNLASGEPKTVSALNYAFQLFMLPHGLFALSVAVVTFPAMARLYGAGDIAGLKAKLVEGLRRIYFFALPATLGLGLLATPIVRSLFELGNFDKTSTQMVSYPLIFFSIGLVGYGVTEIVTRTFYAMHNTIIPVFAAVITVLSNVALSIALQRSLGHGGLALSLALTNTLEALILLYLIRRKLGALDTGNGLWLGMLKITLAGDLMGAFLLLAGWLLAMPMTNLSKIPLMLITGAIIGAAGALFGGAAYLLKIEELKSVAVRFRRRV
ncbi:murein biosynthesis integral membrane protein MurJ [Candidatus Chlorohelix sp.]|uniref:murein biosynthesis integral membrane protein MurJ n=1 Tax=Candidatus Chlorohelix sp. TaxID=3139201 RepID=UPI0030724927